MRAGSQARKSMRLRRGNSMEIENPCLNFSGVGSAASHNHMGIPPPTLSPARAREGKVRGIGIRGSRAGLRRGKTWESRGRKGKELEKLWSHVGLQCRLNLESSTTPRRRPSPGGGPGDQGTRAGQGGPGRTRGIRQTGLTTGRGLWYSRARRWFVTMPGCMSGYVPGRGMYLVRGREGQIFPRKCKIALTGGGCGCMIHLIGSAIPPSRVSSEVLHVRCSHRHARRRTNTSLPAPAPSVDDHGKRLHAGAFIGHVCPTNPI